MQYSGKKRQKIKDISFVFVFLSLFSSSITESAKKRDYSNAATGGCGCVN